MGKVDVKIINKKGLHARAAAAFVKCADRFQATNITVSKSGANVSGKSILGLMTLAASLDSIVTIDAEGGEAEQALKELTELINAKFNED